MIIKFEEPPRFSMNATIGHEISVDRCDMDLMYQEKMCPAYLIRETEGVKQSYFDDDMKNIDVVLEKNSLVIQVPVFGYLLLATAKTKSQIETVFGELFV